MSSENPFEFLGVLVEKLKATKRYISQEILNARAAEKKKQLETELQNRLASAEELVMGLTVSQTDSGSSSKSANIISSFWLWKECALLFN